MTPVSPAAFRVRLAKVKLLSLDTDGVLTDGGLYYTDAGDELRKFNVKDGLGIRRIQAAGVAVAVITASASPAIEHRARYLGVEHVHLEVGDKLQVLTGICDELGYPLEAVAHMGDDLNDVPVFREVGVPITVADAHDAAKAEACWITGLGGGQGAVREICDLIVEVRGGSD